MARHAHMQRIYLPSVLARHRYVTKKRAALFNLAEYALRRAAAREHAIRVLYTRCMRQALQHQDHVQNLRLLCEAANEYHTERLKKKAVQHIRVQTLKNRLAQRNNKSAIAARKNRRLALALVLWQVSCGERIVRAEDHENIKEEENNQSRDTEEIDFPKEPLGTSRMSISERRRAKAGFTNW